VGSAESLAALRVKQVLVVHNFKISEVFLSNLHLGSVFSFLICISFTFGWVYGSGDILKRHS